MASTLTSHRPTFIYLTWVERDHFFLLLLLHPKTQRPLRLHRRLHHEAPRSLYVFALRLRHVLHINNGCSLCSSQSELYMRSSAAADCVQH